MISARTDVVQRAVALIDPDEHRRAECANAVHVALTEITGTDADLRHMAHRRSKRAKRAAVRLHTALHRLQHVRADPDLPGHLSGIFPPAEKDEVPGRGETDRLLTMWLKRIDAVVRSDPSNFRFRPKALKKLVAAEQAYRLLHQFHRDISAAEGSTFCRLAALLHGTPMAKFHHPCKQLVRSRGE